MTALYIVLVVLIVAIGLLRYGTNKIEKNLHDIIAEHEEILHDAEYEKY